MNNLAAKKLVSLLVASLLPVAAAHAVVQTDNGDVTSPVSAYQVYRLQVPSELDSATTEVRLIVPSGITVSRFETMPGFLRTVKKDNAGLITEVTWRGRIAPDEFARFFFQAKNPAQPGDFAWKVYQRYANGTLVSWDDSDKDEYPASHTQVK